jgi:hypothetical protein
MSPASQDEMYICQGKLYCKQYYIGGKVLFHALFEKNFNLKLLHQQD